VTYKNQNDDDVVIPKFYSDGKPITKIGDWAFTWDYIFLDSVAIPNSIVEIGEAAFYGSHISSLILPNSVVTLGEYAFADNRIASLTVPASVRSIGAYGFMNNNMTNLDLPSSVTFIGFYAFNGNQLPKSQAIIYEDESNPIKIASYGNTASTHDVVIPNGVTTIGENAFFGVTINSITLPDTLRTIEGGAFTNTTVLSRVITLPDSVDYIGRRAFYYAKVDTVNLPAGITSILSETFYASSIIDMTIPSSVTSIGNSAFADNDKLASVQFAGTVPMNLGTSIFSSTPLLTPGTINVTDSYIPDYQAKALSNFDKPTTTFH